MTDPQKDIDAVAQAGLDLREQLRGISDAFSGKTRYDLINSDAEVTDSGTILATDGEWAWFKSDRSQARAPWTVSRSRLVRTGTFTRGSWFQTDSGRTVNIVSTSATHAIGWWQDTGGPASIPHRDYDKYRKEA